MKWFLLYLSSCQKKSEEIQGQVADHARTHARGRELWAVWLSQRRALKSHTKNRRDDDARC